MKKSIAEIIEIVFLIYYILFPFYLFNLIAFDDGEYHFHSFKELLPSTYFLLLISLYYSFRKRAIYFIKSIIAFLIVSQIVASYFLFYWFITKEETDSYLLQQIIFYFGIFISFIHLLLINRKVI